MRYGQNEGSPAGTLLGRKRRWNRGSPDHEENAGYTESETHRNIWRSSTHSNPVDLVCASGLPGAKIDLHPFVDWNAVSISEKSHEGGVLKALELPGLWNGSMARWNTVFVESS